MSNYQEYYNYLQQFVLPYIVNTASPRFIGHMTTVLPCFSLMISASWLLC